MIPMKTYTVILQPLGSTEQSTVSFQAAGCTQVANAYLFFDDKKNIIATYQMANVVSITSA